jgi:hypothetical protein
VLKHFKPLKLAKIPYKLYLDNEKQDFSTPILRCAQIAPAKFGRNPKNKLNQAFKTLQKCEENTLEDSRVN